MKESEDLVTVVSCFRGAEAQDPGNNSGDGARGFGMGPMTYAAALTNRPPVTHSSALVRAWVRDSQVLIDSDPQVSSNHLDTLNKRELVTKANEALEKMVGQIGLGPGEPVAVGPRDYRMGEWYMN